jgi:uncharacterized SAM-binding protein YcdF (DUF218 family)
MLSRAWIPVQFFVLLSHCILHCFCVLATMFMSTLVFILFMFFIALFIVYVGYMSSIVDLLLYPYTCSYSAHLLDLRVSGTHYVSVMLRYCLPADALYAPGRVVDRRCDKPIESFVSLPRV